MAKTLKVALLGERYLTKCKKGVIMVLGDMEVGLAVGSQNAYGINFNTF